MSSPNRHTQARMHLAKADPILAPIITIAGDMIIEPKSDYLQALVESIVSQQLSMKAADTIYGRFLKLFPPSTSLRINKAFPHPKHIIAVPHEKLRGAGLSNAKALYIKNIATAVLEKKLGFAAFPQMDNETIIAQLVQIKGIGRWTAEMFLMFTMARPDIFSYGDLGLKNAMKKLYSLKEIPTQKEALELSEKWKPYRTYACRYLWRSLEIK